MTLVCHPLGVSQGLASSLHGNEKTADGCVRVGVPFITLI